MPLQGGHELLQRDPAILVRVSEAKHGDNAGAAPLEGVFDAHQSLVELSNLFLDFLALILLSTLVQLGILLSTSFIILLLSAELLS